MSLIVTHLTVLYRIMMFKTNITNSFCKDLNDSRDMQNGYNKATPSCHCYDYNQKE